mgnify:FL=1|jgi:hypothetical protein
MAIINSYPTVTPTEGDLVLISDVSEDGNPTRTATVSSLGLLSQGGGLVGPTGPQGNAGVAGVAGAAGAAGANGTNGADGAPGTNGANGADGANGAQGVAGADGTSISILGTVADCAALPSTGNTIGDLYILDAADGGCPGGAGVAGDGFVWTAGNVWLNIGPIRGPQGTQGVTGTDGADGADGTDGNDGAAGAAGAAGTDGVDGVQGAQGIQGNQGIQGPPGSLGPGTKNSIPLWTTTTTLGDSFLQQTDNLPGDPGRIISTKGFQFNSRVFDKASPTPSQGTDKQVLTGGDNGPLWKNLEDIGAVVNTTDVNFTPPIVSYIVSLSQGEYNGLVGTPPITFDNTLYVII